MRRCERLEIVVGVMAALALMSGEAAAVPLGLGSSTLEVTCLGDTDTRTSTRSVHTAACDVVSDTVSASALAEAYLTTPEVFVQTSASAGASALATSTITLKLRVNEKRRPPFPTSVIDVGSIKFGEVSLFGVSFGSVRLSLDGPMHSDTTLALGPPNFANERISVGIVPNTAYDVTLRASCQSAAGGTCLAALDPAVFLDQDAFDARLGANSYPLADFYDVEISANAPEAGTGLLLMTGILGLAASGRRRWVARDGSDEPARLRTSSS